MRARAPRNVLRALCLRVLTLEFWPGSRVRACVDACVRARCFESLREDARYWRSTVLNDACTAKNERDRSSVGGLGVVVVFAMLAVYFLMYA